MPSDTRTVVEHNAAKIRVAAVCRKCSLSKIRIQRQVDLLHQFGEPFWRDKTIASLHKLLNLAPVGRCVEAHTNPVVTAHIGRDKKGLRVSADEDRLATRRCFAPEGFPTVPDLIPHSPDEVAFLSALAVILG